MTPERKALEAARRLTELYGSLPLKPRRKPMHELISTMLSHRTTQKQEDVAYHRLYDHFGSWQAIADAPMGAIADELEGVRWPGQKAAHIKEALKMIFSHEGRYSLDFLGQLSTEEAMAFLTSLPGVGLKTASLVLLFCFGRAVIPVDTHVFRVCTRLGLWPAGTTAEKAHEILLSLLPHDPHFLYNFHIHMLWHGQRVCTFARPKHDECPLTDICRFYHEERKKEKKKASRQSTLK